MKLEFEKRLIIGERPTQAPITAIIFNAPRPLFGTLINDEPLTWKGEFCAGVYYAAVTGEDEKRKNWIVENRKNAATILEYITEEEARQMVKPELLFDYPDLTEDDFNFVWKNIFDTYHRNNIVEIEV